MLLIAIDGACRRNGSPDCVAAGGVYIMQYDDNYTLVNTQCKTAYEQASTNQRGEMLALMTALDYVYATKQPSQIITDSEYLFNTMVKDWCGGWQRKGWITSTGGTVKNRDIWEQIYRMYNACKSDGIEVLFYHVKGHCIPFGRVTANNILDRDPSGRELLNEVTLKYHAVKDTKNVYSMVAALSEKNNGFIPSPEIMERLVVSNTIADIIATRCVDAVDDGNEPPPRLNVLEFQVE